MSFINEEAIDTGGPSKEFWRLIVPVIGSNFCIGPLARMNGLADALGQDANMNANRVKVNNCLDRLNRMASASVFISKIMIFMITGNDEIRTHYIAPPQC